MRISDWSSDVCSSDLVTNFETRCKMIREGLGVGIVPEMIARNYLTSMGLVLLRLDDEWASRSFFACVHNPEECDNIVLSLLRSSEARRVGIECVSTCSSRWAPEP